MPNKSKNKGSAFEREIAKALTEATGAEWLRSSGSGAFFGGRNFHRTATASQTALRDRSGDLTPPDGIRMTVECKRYKELPDVMSGSSAQLESWLAQLMESSQPDDFMILIMKGDRKPALAAVEAKHGMDECVKGNHLRYRMESGDWTICGFDDFLGNAWEKAKGIASARL